jgi:IMP dehydrogenase
MPIISDGSIKKPADFVKAIGAGASAVMGGQIFARCPESAAPIIEVDGIKKKVYSGMASRVVQEKWRGKVHNDCPEGKTIFLDIGEPVEKLLNRYCGALRSGISYGGFDNISDFLKNCEFILV